MYADTFFHGGVERQDHMDSKSVQSGVTSGLPSKSS